MKNKRSSGVDGMKTTELMNYLVHHWGKTKEDLLAGKYKPQKVRGVEIPKKSGGSRQLGIPTVIDRLIQPKYTSSAKSDMGTRVFKM
jgi:RNA-directed DNA polymerase